MHFNDVVATGAQVASEFNSQQVIAFLAVVIVLVFLSMMWRAWSSVFVQTPTRRSRRSSGRTRRNEVVQHGGQGGAER
ncbi:hypothetical protein [Hyalangium minutum]|uniref:Uncharacterized protein n=1 Tax=Hyalangium minutum TaxID=394096 RepID=A0A085WVN8_9BACT|nr:hypothetical protein [Hyalangium minutum]KFE71751.1 hypothetical protein DB31_0012 [Hyalangium minutum]